MSNPETPASRIAALRAAGKLSARRLSLISGLADGHVGLIEAGTLGAKRGLEGKTLAALAKTLGATVAWIEKGEGVAPDEAAVLRAVKRASNRHEKSVAPALVKPDGCDGADFDAPSARPSAPPGAS